MPIYDYTCTACGTTTEVVHGIHDHGPRFCPECGAEGTMKKSFAPPAIVFKGSGWAKKDRGGPSTKPGAKARVADGGESSTVAPSEGSSSSAAAD